MIKLATAVVLAISMASAGKSNTKEELTRMAATGAYPDQGPTRVVSDKPMSMDRCRLAAETIGSATGENYPTAIITDTAILYSIKFWTNDGVLLATCGDGNLVLNQADYK